MIRTSYRSALAILALGITAMANAQYASPELMIIYDSGSADGTQPAQFERYDPITRQYLGAFGAGTFPNLGPGTFTNSMTVMGHDVYLLESNGGSNDSVVLGYNFSTGAIDYSHVFINAGYMRGMAAVNGDLVVGGDTHGVLDVLDPSANTSTTLRVHDFNGFTGIAGKGSTLAVSGEINSQEVFATYQLGPGDTSITGNANVPGDGYYSMALSADQSGNMRVFGVGGKGDPYGIEERDAVTGSLLDTSDSLGTYFVTNSIVATGHKGELYYLTSGNQVAVLDDDLPLKFSGTGSPLLSLPETATASMIAVYAAPEPSGYLAFAVGGLSLLVVRRRRKA
jgi:hypothetical protein